MIKVVIEGIIASGKSYFAREISYLYDFDLYEEPVQDNPYLDRYYKNPKRYALEMQLYLLVRRYIMHQKAISKGKHCVFDRSIYGDLVFENVNHDVGNIDDVGHNHYMLHRNHMLDEIKPPDYVIFLNATPEICLDRILNLRKRDCESNITLDYLKKLHEYHFVLMEEFKSRGSEIIELDWNEFKDIKDIKLF